MAKVFKNPLNTSTRYRLEGNADIVTFLAFQYWLGTEVSTFDNTRTNQFPLDKIKPCSTRCPSEYSISSEIYYSMESECFLNVIPCHLEETQQLYFNRPLEMGNSTIQSWPHLELICRWKKNGTRWQLWAWRLIMKDVRTDKSVI